VNCGLEAQSDTTCTGTLGVPGDEPTPLPMAFGLRRIAPNPFHGRATIAFDVPRHAPLAIRVYDVSGRLVRTLKNGAVDPGRHAIDWDGRDDARKSTASGIYFVEMQAPGFRKIGRLTLLK